MTPEQLSQVALDVASGAAAYLITGWRRPLEVSKKGKTDLVTEYDLESERRIRDELARRTPDIPVFAEEGGGELGAGLGWACDPLDGTTNFVHGHPFFCVSIGLLDAGRPVAGAVVAPALGNAWRGFTDSQSRASFRDGKPCHVTGTEQLGDALLATGFPYENRDQEPGNNFASFVRIKQHCRAARRCGSAALDLCLVADGTYDGYWERHLNVWDYAAGAALVLGAGGRLSALDGSSADLTSGHLVATNGKIHDRLVALI